MRKVNVLRAGNGNFARRGLSKGVEKGFINIIVMPVKPDNHVGIHLLLFDPGHVLLAPLLTASIDSAKVLLRRCLVSTIRVLVVTSAEISIAHELQRFCNLMRIPDIRGAH